MNRKERVLSAINFKGVDRIPTTFRGVDVFSVSLMKSFNMDDIDDIAGNYKSFLKKIGADFWSSGSKISRFSSFIPKFKGGPPVPPYIDDGSLFHAVGINSVIGRIDKYDYEYPVFGVDPPLARINSADEIKDGFLLSKLDLFDFKSMVKKKNKETGCKEIKGSNDDFICIGSLTSFFMICSYLRGMDNFFMDLAFNKRLAGKIIDEVGQFCLEYNRRELLAFGNKAEYYGTWDDFAGQDGMMVSPEIFKKYFLPLYRKLIENNKKYGLIFSWHCCGSIHKILPYMIDAGIDIFDVVQTSAKDMGLENINRLYGKSVCLHGGIDVQDLLIRGNTDDVKNEVKKVKNLWGSRGGIILAPSHEILPDTPVENVLALYKEINEF
jgi:uroporphyrinogen decarboxylase